MRVKFPLFQTPIDLAHQFWKNIVKPGDVVIDATAGNGKDSLFLARLLNGSGILKIYDIQALAIENTRKLLKKNLSEKEFLIVEFLLSSHAKFVEENVKLIVYNLGYLPGGDKSITTYLDSTLKSISSAMDCLVDGGVISIICYPGHEEGKKEEKALLNMTQQLSNQAWSISYHQWINRHLSPSLILLQKKERHP